MCCQFHQSNHELCPTRLSLLTTAVANSSAASELPWRNLRAWKLETQKPCSQVQRWRAREGRLPFSVLPSKSIPGVTCSQCWSSSMHSKIVNCLAVKMAVQMGGSQKLEGFSEIPVRTVSRRLIHCMAVFLTFSHIEPMVHDNHLNLTVTSIKQVWCKHSHCRHIVCCFCHPAKAIRKKSKTKGPAGTGHETISCLSF